MKKLMVAVGAVLAGAMAMASTPASFAYQGVLRDDVGKAIGVSSAKITFRLYNDPTAEGSALWFQTQTVSLDTNGLFNAELGDPTNGLAAVIAESEADGNSLYIGLTVDGSAGEIRPRQKLIAAPLAAFAQNVRETKGDLTINGTAYFKGPVSMMDDKKTLTGGNIDAKGTLTASGKATLNGGAQVGGDMTVSGEASVDSLTVAQNVEVTNGDIELASGKTVKAGGVNIGVPIGCILMWSGEEGDIPDGWALCDGKTHNGKMTPNLLGRFIVGAGDSYLVGATGGVDKVVLTKRQMPNHTHAYLSDTQINGSIASSAYGKDSNGYNTGWIASDESYVFNFKSDSNGHGRRYMTGTAGGDATDTYAGSDGMADAHENRPPYYALCFIMKVK